MTTCFNLLLLLFIEPIPQPVYNYEAILEVRRIEREERKRQRDLKRKEKERRRFERAKRRTEKILGKSKVELSAGIGDLFNKPCPSILASLTKDVEENADGETEEPEVATPTVSRKEESDEAAPLKRNAAVMDEDEDADEEEVDEQEPEEDEEENQDGAVITKQEEIKLTVIPPPPAKGILILPGFV